MAEPTPTRPPIVRATLVRRVERVVTVLDQPATPSVTNPGPRDRIVCQTCGQPWHDHGRSPTPHPWVALRVPTSRPT